ncbi:MAG TPA: protein YgfX [Cellvibrio sp.]|nr:protein YgfX [Cellvibrio sp.]
MSEKIPGFSQTKNKPPPRALVTELAAVTALPSRYLCYGQLVIYLVLLVSSALAVFPYLLSNPYLLGLWLVFGGAIVAAARKSLADSRAAAKTLSIIQHQWRLAVDGHSYAVILNEKLLLWPWLIVIPLRESLSYRQHYFIALPDSMSQAEWRRLSVWLRTCLQHGV